jgi:hypothetical protein
MMPNGGQVFITFGAMIPDYPHKIFGDRRMNYSLLMTTLAMDTPTLRG